MRRVGLGLTTSCVSLLLSTLNVAAPGPTSPSQNPGDMAHFDQDGAAEENNDADRDGIPDVYDHYSGDAMCKVGPCPILYDFSEATWAAIALWRSFAP